MFQIKLPNLIPRLLLRKSSRIKLQIPTSHLILVNCELRYLPSSSLLSPRNLHLDPRLYSYRQRRRWSFWKKGKRHGIHWLLRKSGNWAWKVMLGFMNCRKGFSSCVTIMSNKQLEPEWVCSLWLVMIADDSSREHIDLIQSDWYPSLRARTQI